MRWLFTLISACEVKIHDIIEVLKKEEEFEARKLSFLTHRRSAQYKRKITTMKRQIIKNWLSLHSDLIESLITSDKEKNKMIKLLYTWKDVFMNDVRDMSTTDLMKHKILIYRHYVLKETKTRLYTKTEKN